MNRKKLLNMGLVFLSCTIFLVGCGNDEEKDNVSENAATDEENKEVAVEISEDTVQIILSDDGITVDGTVAATEDTEAVYIANDIVYYEDGKDFTYGEGTEADAHSKEEADAHTVVHITEPGNYEISGTLSAGQIAVDLGEDAKEDPEAVVTLILNNADISCSVAPAVIFYDVYECGTKDEEQATNTVDTSAAGANVMIADGSTNNVSGSYVARIYESYELNEEGTEVVDSEKLHKYDAAFYSKRTMNVNGGAEGTGVLNITAENEGLDSELHLTLNGGNINIVSGNDGINTNEDGISVTTINGGNLNITVDGSTGEGDGIDSNGWLVINGGTVTAAACATSGDAGIDSDMGIYINGGSVVATGNMLDQISESNQNYLVLNFAERQNGETNYSLKNEAGSVVGEYTPANDFTYFIISDAELTEGTYSMWMGEKQLEGTSSDGMTAGFGMGGRPEGMERPEGAEMPEGMERPEGVEMPEGMERPEGVEMPEGMERPEGTEIPEGMEHPEGAEMPEGMERPEGVELPEGIGDESQGFPGNHSENAEPSAVFTISVGGNYYSNVAMIEN